MKKVIDPNLVQIRQGEEPDRNLIMSTWANGQYFGFDWFKQIRKTTFNGVYTEVIKAILGRPSVDIRVCSLREDGDIILGYCVTEQRKSGCVLHWIYVKPSWRKLGIAKLLLPPNITITTHMTALGANLKPKEWEFNPFLI